MTEVYKNSTLIDSIRRTTVKVGLMLGAAAMIGGCGEDNSQAEAVELPPVVAAQEGVLSGGINNPATVTEQAVRLNQLNQPPTTPTPDNGLSLVGSYNQNYIRDDQIETSCIARDLGSGFYFMQAFYKIRNLSNNPTIGPGGFVSYDFDFHTGLFGSGGPYYPDSNGEITIESISTSLREQDARSWKGTTTFSNYNSSNINSPIQTVPTSVYATDIPCRLVP